MKRALMVVGVVLVVGSASAAAQPTRYVVEASRWRAEQTAAVEAAGGRVMFGHDGAGLAVVEADGDDFISRLQATTAVSRVTADRTVQWQQPMVGETVVNAANDTFYPIQWAPQAVEAPAAWAAGYDGSGVRVAILDGGIHAAHQDLDANVDVAASRSFVPGFDFNEDTGTFWHGTHVAGIVAAEDNVIGTVGIAPRATLVGVKVLHSGRGSFGGVIQGILYAATPLAEGGGGADIINMSLGAVFPRSDPGAAALVSAMNKSVNYANRFGVLVVSAAGNSSLDLDHSGDLIAAPAESGSGIAVSSTGPLGFAYGATNFRRPASYTNYGTSVIHVAAPGGDFAYPGNELCTMPVVNGSVTRRCWVFDMVLSTSRGLPASTSSYAWAAGTSMAAPAVAAVAALVKQAYPNISLGALKTKLARSADDEGKPGADPFYGKGFVNARKAVH